MKISHIIAISIFAYSTATTTEDDFEESTTLFNLYTTTFPSTTQNYQHQFTTPNPGAADIFYTTLASTTATTATSYITESSDFSGSGDHSGSDQSGGSSGASGSGAQTTQNPFETVTFPVTTSLNILVSFENGKFILEIRNQLEDVLFGDSWDSDYESPVLIEFDLQEQM